jgi:hypothetical protein
MASGTSGAPAHRDEHHAMFGGPSGLQGISKSVMLRKSGLEFHQSLSFQDWELAGQQILKFMDSSAWWVADWLAYGEASFSDRYREAIQRTSLNYQTLRNYAWIARRFELSRRRDTLSFAHHAEVAALEQPEQDYWLRKADEHHWSRNKLRAEVRNSLRERRHAPVEAASLPQGPAGDAAGQESDAVRAGPTADQRLWVRLNSDQLARFKKAALRQSLTLDEWVVKTLSSAAGHDQEAMAKLAHCRSPMRQGRRHGTFDVINGNGAV